VSGVPKGTIGRWRSERHDFATCLERRGDSWEITKVGHRALDINWTNSIGLSAEISLALRKYVFGT